MRYSNRKVTHDNINSAYLYCIICDCNTLILLTFKTKIEQSLFDIVATPSTTETQDVIVYKETGAIYVAS